MIRGLGQWASTYSIDRRWTIGRAQFHFTMRRADGYMGRFGGGWQWKVGIQAGSWRSFIVSLLIAELRFYLPVKPSQYTERKP